MDWNVIIGFLWCFDLKTRQFTLKVLLCQNPGRLVKGQPMQGLASFAQNCVQLFFQCPSWTKLD